MRSVKRIVASAVALAAIGCSAAPDSRQADNGTGSASSLFDAPLTQTFYEDGAAYFEINNGELTTRPNDGARFKLRTRESFADFDLTVEFMVEPETNSGIYIRCDTPDNVNPNTCYEINIFDANRDESNRTGAIMRVAPQMIEVPTAGQWSTLNIRAQGEHILVKVNGVTTVDITDNKHAAGIMAIQYAENGRLLKMRNFTVAPL